MDAERADRARPGRSRRLVRGRGRSLHAGRAKQSPGRPPRLRPRRARQPRRRPGLERDARPPACDRIVNGFGWAWIVLGDSRGAQRILGRSTPPARRPRSATGPAPFCWPPGSKRRQATSSSLANTSPRPANSRTRSMTSTCRRAAATTWPTSCRMTASSRQAMELTDRSSALYQRARPAVGSGRELALRRPSRDLRRRPRARRRGSRSGRALAADGRRPMAARPPRRDARRARPDRASFRRRRPAHRPSRGDVWAARLPADGGLPALQPRAGAVPGRRLRVRRGHAGARDREGRSHR